MGAAELRWLEKYEELVINFQNSFGENGLNLLLNMDPPRSLYVKVGIPRAFSQINYSLSFACCAR